MISPKKQKINIFICSMLAVFGFTFPAFAGTIDSEYKYAYGENIGWINFGSSDGAVQVTDAGLSGYAWTENSGWISLDCSDNDSCASSDYGVANDGEGNLSGYAYGENIGWINFAPSDGGVVIDSEGNFSGYAWGENVGWISFSCEDADVCGSSNYKVKTDWRTESETSEEDDDGENGDFKVKKVTYSATDNSITIRWETNEKADSHVRWGMNKNLGKEKDDDDLEKKHKTVLKKLDSDTTYYFRIRSTDGDGNTDVSKIYSAKTDAKPPFYSPRSWLPLESDEEKTEELKIDVSDSEEKNIEEAADTFTSGEEDIAVQEQEEKGPGFFAKTFSLVTKLSGSVSDSIKSGLISFQKKIASIFDGRKKLLSEAEKNFATRVFKDGRQKRIAEVRFQILDRKNSPLANLETTLFSDPKTTVTDEKGIAVFKDVPVGDHTLAFSHDNEQFNKKVAIADTLTENGTVMAEVVQVKAQRDKVTWWMWAVIILLLIAIYLAVYFGMKYKQLKGITGK